MTFPTDGPTASSDRHERIIATVCLNRLARLGTSVGAGCGMACAL